MEFLAIFFSAFFKCLPADVKDQLFKEQAIVEVTVVDIDRLLITLRNAELTCIGKIDRPDEGALDGMGVSLPISGLDCLLLFIIVELTTINSLELF